MILRVELNIVNAQAGTNRLVRRQFDPASMTAAKWAAAWPLVQGLINELKDDATTNPNEPETW